MSFSLSGVYRRQFELETQGLVEMSVTAALVKELREKSGAGMMDCKQALGESGGDMDAAIDWLRAKGLATAAKKLSLIHISEPTRPY